MGYSDATQHRRFISTSKKAFAPHVLKLIEEVNQEALNAGYNLDEEGTRWVIVESGDSDYWTVVLRFADDESFVASSSIP